MAPRYKVDPKTGAIIFQRTPEEKNLQEYLKVLNSINSNLLCLMTQNNTIIEQNNKILQLLSSKGGIMTDE
ncbi:MAG: hypothetical protein IKB64_10460 [Paludibacteraceae bacterium]|nr:hypothetical protein [Paludibacteraceae bacterium]